MKKFILSLACFFLILTGFAQLPKPKPIGLPSPKLKIYKPADLQISEIRLVNVTKDEARGLYLVNVSLRIKNTGELQSQPGKLKGFNTAGFNGIKAPNHPPMKDINDWNRSSLEAVPSPWTVCGNQPDLPAVSEGGSIYQDFQFEMSISNQAMVGAKFYFVVLADLYNSTKESNENNNYSTAIFITPPAH